MQFTSRREITHKEVETIKVPLKDTIFLLIQLSMAGCHLGDTHKKGPGHSKTRLLQGCMLLKKEIGVVVYYNLDKNVCR